jgi:KDO2-lipid IV(A) lauroyltransferase
VLRQPASSAGQHAYSFRRGALSREVTIWIDGNALRWSDGHHAGSMTMSDIEEVQICRRYRPGRAALTHKLMWTCHLRGMGGQRLVISPLHYSGYGSWQDRSQPYWHFINLLTARAYAAHPQLRVTHVIHSTTRLRRRLTKSLVGPLMVGLLKALRMMRCEYAAGIVAAAMRVIGPWLHAHRIARANLVAAFPEKSSGEIERILAGMWNNLGRVCAEYAHLDRLFDFDPAMPSHHIVVDEATLERLQRLRTANRPALLFGGHLANWELAAAAPVAMKLDFAALYRRPQLGVAAAYLAALRTRSMGAMIAADGRAALQIARTLKRGGVIGMLVDQHANSGIDVTFFGRRCKVRPTLAQLARRFDCQVHGVRVIRLPNARYRVELTEPLELPRDSNAEIDIGATMQLVTSMIEAWIREHPEKWLWQHRRWR